MLPSRFGQFAAIAIVLAAASQVQAQGFYYRTVQQNPMNGRRELLDLQRPRWTSGGQGGMAYDPSIGSMQMAAVGRNRFTGRLEYYNYYMNPWTGAQQSTATQFNPFSGRYESLHRFEPPREKQPQPQAVEVTTTTDETPPAKTKRRVRVIDTQLDTDAPPVAVAPGATLPDIVPGGTLPPQEQASSKTIEWKKDHPESTHSIKSVPATGL